MSKQSRRVPLAVHCVLWGLLALSLAAGSARAESRALLIGVGAYKYISPLTGPANDVVKMKRLLQQELGYQPHQMMTLTDGKATRQRILAALQAFLVEGTRPGDRVLIYYSGHGSQVRDTSGDEADGRDETLVPVDGKAGGQNQITDDEISAVLRKLQGREVTLIIDSCHSGTISRGWQPKPGDATARTVFPPASRSTGEIDRNLIAAHRTEESFVKALPGHSVWSAAAANQYSWETGGEGVFTGFLIDGTADRKADRNGNGIVTNAELLAYVRGKTKQWCDVRPDCRKLGFTPELEAPAEMLEKALVPVGASASEPAEILVEEEPAAEEAPASVRLEILPQSTVHLGDEVRFRVTSSRSGWLILLDINANGEVFQLFPNDIASAHGQDNRIQANRPITVPDAYYGFAFPAQEPDGHGQLMAIVTRDRVALADLLAENGDFSAIADGKHYLAQLAKRLQEVWRQDQTNRSADWSLAIADYEILK